MKYIIQNLLVLLGLKSLAKTVNDNLTLHEIRQFKHSIRLINISRHPVPVIVALANHSSISVLMTSIKEVARDRAILIISLF